jgi:hypothetical protein
MRTGSGKKVVVKKKIIKKVKPKAGEAIAAGAATDPADPAA